MQIKFFSVMVDNQDKALRFYTSVLGFVKMADLPVAQFRCLTVTSPEGVEGVELVLELVSFPPAQVYQKTRFDGGVPAIAFITNDIHVDYRRLKERGVIFRGEPKNMGLKHLRSNRQRRPF